MSSASRMVADWPGIASSIGAVEGVDGRDGAAMAGGQHDDGVARAPGAAGDLAGVAAVVVVLVRHRADHPLHREAAVGRR